MAVILHVEDEPAHALLVERALAQAALSCRIKHVPDGQSALDYLYRRNGYEDPAASPRPAMILLDMRLPAIDGIEVLRTIKNNPAFRSLPVIMLTSSRDLEDMRRACLAGADDYFTKPADFAHLIKGLDHLVKRWLVNRQPAETFANSLALSA